MHSAWILTSLANVGSDRDAPPPLPVGLSSICNGLDRLTVLQWLKRSTPAICADAFSSTRKEIVQYELHTWLALRTTNRASHITESSCRIDHVAGSLRCLQTAHTPRMQRVCREFLMYLSAVICSTSPCFARGYSAAWSDQNSTLLRQPLVFYLYHACSKRLMPRLIDIGLILHWTIQKSFFTICTGAVPPKSRPRIYLQVL